MEINGLPAHALLVHIVLVMLPLASAMAVLGSLWPAAQRKFTFLTPLAALVGLVSVPITVKAGEQLAEMIGMNPAIAEHSTLGRWILLPAALLFVCTAVQWAYFAYFKARRRWMTVLLAVLVIASATAATIQVTLAGDAGAQMVWGGVG
jgi:hypothetical protein